MNESTKRTITEWMYKYRKEITFVMYCGMNLYWFRKYMRLLDRYEILRSMK